MRVNWRHCSRSAVCRLFVAFLSVSLGWPQQPERPHDLMGMIKRIIPTGLSDSPASTNRLAEILIEPPIRRGFGPHKAWVTVTTQTRISYIGGGAASSPAKVNDLQPGLFVFVRTDRILMTYPVRAMATELSVVRPPDPIPSTVTPGTRPLPPGQQGIRIGSEMLARRLIHRIAPVYPEEAKRLRIEGTVLLQVLVNEKGEVVKADVMQGHTMLVQAAVDAVMQWRYRPFLLNDKPIPVIATVSVAFILR